MSSACVCHTDQWCFYCEMYSPLERKHEQQTRAIKKVKDELAQKRDLLMKNSLGLPLINAQMYLCSVEALDFALDRLKAVIEDETNSPHSPDGRGTDDRARQIR